LESVQPPGRKRNLGASFSQATGELGTQAAGRTCNQGNIARNVE
jgi:hypothetical protein